MKQEIKKRIEMINRGEVPYMYKKTTLGIIPTKWIISSINTSFNIINNTRTPISENERKKIQGPYPYYGPTGIQDYINTYKYDGRYALIGEDGDHFLKYHERPITLLVEGKFNVNNHAHVLQGKNNNLTEWFYYYYRNKNIYPYLTRQGAKRYKLNKATLEIMPIILPSHQEQQKITDILYAWDKAIALKEKLIEQKMEQKKGLMQNLLTGKVRIPGFDKDWIQVKLGDVLNFKKKQSLSNPQDYYLLTVKLHLKGIEATNKKPNITTKGRPYYLRKPGELLIGRQNFHNGGIGIIPKHMVGYIASNAITSIEAKKGNLKFYYYSLSNCDFYKRIGHLIGGTGQKEISETSMKNLKLITPPSIEEQNAITSILSTVDKEIQLFEKELEELKQQKKGLMQLLLTGKVRVNS